MMDYLLLLCIQVNNLIDKLTNDDSLIVDGNDLDLERFVKDDGDENKKCAEWIIALSHALKSKISLIYSSFREFKMKQNDFKIDPSKCVHQN